MSERRNKRIVIDRFTSPVAKFYEKLIPADMDIVMTELLSKIRFKNIAPFILLSRSTLSRSFFAFFISFFATDRMALNRISPINVQLRSVNRLSNVIGFFGGSAGIFSPLIFSNASSEILSCARSYKPKISLSYGDGTFSPSIFICSF